MTIAVIDGRIDTSIPELQGADIQDMTACTIQTNADSDDHATFIAQLLVAPDFGVGPRRDDLQLRCGSLAQRRGRRLWAGDESIGLGIRRR